MTAGRPSPTKNIHGVLGAFEMWSNPDAVFIGVGAKGLNYPNRNPRVHLTDFRSDVTDLYYLADCFVSAPVTEAFGLTIVEAMSSGVQVVVKDDQGPGDIARENLECIKVATGRKSAILDGIKIAYRRRDFKPTYNLNLYSMSDQIAKVAEYYKTL